MFECSTWSIWTISETKTELLLTKVVEGFDECSEKEVEQTIVLHYLGLSDAEKSLATRAVTSAFPSSYVKRVMRSGQN